MINKDCTRPSISRAILVAILVDPGCIAGVRLISRPISTSALLSRLGNQALEHYSSLFPLDQVLSKALCPKYLYLCACIHHFDSLTLNHYLLPTTKRLEQKQGLRSRKKRGNERLEASVPLNRLGLSFFLF